MASRAIFAAVLLIFSTSIEAQTSRQAATRPYKPPPSPKAEDWPDERLARFQRELAEFVYANHVVRDESRKVYGMTYEFFTDGKQMQEFGLDAMHDGAWFTSAMIVAARIDKDPWYLQQVQKYQVPFYTNLLNNSDRLFPNMKPTNEDKKPLAAPVKGWCPRGWDDGKGFSKNTGKPLPDDYFTASNHLAQDLADMLLNVWLTTHDPAVAQAAMNLQNYRNEHFGSIKAVEFAAGVTNGKPELYQKYKPPSFSLYSLPEYYCGMYANVGTPLPSYDDPLAWDYRQATANFLLTGGIPREFIAHTAAKCLSHQMAMEMFYDDRPYPYGTYCFDISTPPKFTNGKLSAYASNSKTLMGARGVQISWVAAGILPGLKKSPEAWEEYYRKNRRPDDMQVQIAYHGGTLCQWSSVDDKNITVSLACDPRTLHMLVKSGHEDVTIAIKPAGATAGQARTGIFHIAKGGAVTATNDLKQELLFTTSPLEVDKLDDRAMRLSVPYTFVNGQNSWVSGSENGRYAVSINGGEPQIIYMLSDGNELAERLEQTVLGTIQTWYDVWKEKKMIPSGWRGPNMDRHSWEISDAGNYAHMIHTIALWRIYKAGKSDWELIKNQTPAQPKPCQPLPDSVLRAQGLK